jgi:hypothetical protein
MHHSRNIAMMAADFPLGHTPDSIWERAHSRPVQKDFFLSAGHTALALTRRQSGSPASP